MPTQDGGHRGRAVEALAERAYERAGDAYTRAAWRVLADPRPDRGPFDQDEQGWVGEGLAALVTAAVCYRVAGRAERATHRGVEGVAVARDLRTTVDTPAQRACLAEIVADCRVAGGLDGAGEAYADAAGEYEAAAGEITEPRRWATTPLFEAAAAPIEQVARGQADGEIAVEWADLHGADPEQAGPFLAHRARYKRRQFPGLVATAVEQGHLAAPRGTTAYATDEYHCPACGASDANWVAESVLCLRCSTPMERS